MSLLQRIWALDASHLASQYTALVVAGQCVGQVQNTIVPLLLQSRDPSAATAILEEIGSQSRVLRLKETYNSTLDSRTAAFEHVTDHLIACGVVKQRHGERFPVAAGWGVDELATVDRNTAPYLGCTSVGCHVHCFVRGPDGCCDAVWLAQRAQSKSNFPGRWDPTAAGGVPVGISLRQNAIKEAAEEAGVNPELGAKMVAAGALSMMTAKSDGSCLKQSIYFNFDLEVDESWRPIAVDGEVAAFKRLTLSELEEEVRRGDLLRPAMVAVMADFLIRHGWISPDREQDYIALQTAMHRERLVFASNL